MLVLVVIFSGIFVFFVFVFANIWPIFPFRGVAGGASPATIGGFGFPGNFFADDGALPFMWGPANTGPSYCHLTAYLADLLIFGSHLRSFPGDDWGIWFPGRFFRR